jgi:hypothetical protein
MVAAGAAVTGLAAGVAYFAYRRHRNSAGMLDEGTMLGLSSHTGEAGIEMNGPEHLTESIAEIAHGPNDPQ